MDKHHPAPGHPLSRVRICGDCDHGLWHADTDTITTPGAVEIPIRGVAPAQTREYESDQGDSIAVRVPGTPAVVRSPEELAADAAAGRTWLDYGILAGGARRLYGHELGERAWIYCAPDGSRWVARIGLGSPTQLTLQRFGEIPGSPADAGPVQAAVIAFSVMPSLTTPPWPDYEYNVIDDVRSDGSEAIVSVGYHYSQSNTFGSGAIASYGLRWPYGVYRVAIAGTPPAAVVTVTPMYAGLGLGYLSDTFGGTLNLRGVHVFQDEHDSTALYYVGNYGGPVTPPPGTVEIEYWNLTDGTTTGEDLYILGGCYVADVATPVLLRKSYVVTTTITWIEVEGDPFTGIEYTESYDASSTITLEIGTSVVGATATDAGARIGYQSLDILVEPPPAVGDGAMTLGGLTISARPSAGAADYRIASTPAELSHHEIMPMRVGNRVWALCLINLGALAPEVGGYLDAENRGWGGHTHVGFVSPTDAVQTLVQRPLTLEREDVTGYASAHPTTGEIAWSWDHPVCWV